MLLVGASPLYPFETIVRFWPVSAYRDRQKSANSGRWWKYLLAKNNHPVIKAI
jgi:hypothetical protein